MNTIILTCAGRAERFAKWGGSKWRLTHPSGNIMAAESLRSLGPVIGSWQIVIALNAHDCARYDAASVRREFVLALGLPEDQIRVVSVGTTATRAETVLLAGAAAELRAEDAVCVRDCDNALRFALAPENAVAVADMTECGAIDAGARSFVTIGEDRVVGMAQERGMVTRWFCAGAYVFENWETARSLLVGGSHMTDAIRRGSEQGVRFAARVVSGYEDWGTGQEWSEMRSSYRTIFVDVDGVLLATAHRSFYPTWGSSEPLLKNCAAMRDLYDTGRVHIVLTTSRPESLREDTTRQLAAAGVRFHRLVMDLPACGRVLINDVVPTRGERTADALNVPRDADGSLADSLFSLGLG